MAELVETYGRRPTSESLHHLALPDDWAAAQSSGAYRVSTRGASLDDVGFIHLSYGHQWPVVRAAFYADVASELLLLEIDAAQVVADVVIEVGDPQTGELFPHLYAPLPVEAVADVTHLAPPHGGQG